MLFVNVAFVFICPSSFPQAAFQAHFNVICPHGVPHAAAQIVPYSDLASKWEPTATRTNCLMAPRIVFICLGGLGGMGGAGDGCG